jgi:predicted TIM-barrel fold metal-dependent hydrolase
MADILEKILEYAGEKGELVRRDHLAPRERRYRIVSVDDHVFEPPDVCTARVAAKFRDHVPHVVRKDGIDYWVIAGESVPLLGADAIQGWEKDKRYLGPVTFDEVHPAVFDIRERVRHLDVCGILASLSFPSAPFGFAGTAFLRMKDRQAGLAAMRAYNDWHLEQWAAPFPDRVIPCQVSWLADPEVAASEIRFNVERGFKAVAFTENPLRLGLPSLYSGEWDSFFAACEETETVINLHVGSSSETIVPSPESPPAVLGSLFALNSMIAATDWLFARIPVRFPNIKIAMSEGGIGWVPMLIDRINFLGRQLDYSVDFGAMTPVDVLRRNFWFALLSEPSLMPVRDVIGVDHIMIETDYPHIDSTWPDSQDVLAEQLEGLPEHEVELITHRNALSLYRHQLAGETL